MFAALESILDLNFSEVKRVYSTIVYFTVSVFQTSKTQHEEELIIQLHSLKKKKEG